MGIVFLIAFVAMIVLIVWTWPDYTITPTVMNVAGEPKTVYFIYEGAGFFSIVSKAHFYSEEAAKDWVEAARKMESA